jgi:hypothetical protein
MQIIILTQPILSLKHKRQNTENMKVNEIHARTHAHTHTYTHTHTLIYEFCGSQFSKI